MDFTGLQKRRNSIAGYSDGLPSIRSSAKISESTRQANSASLPNLRRRYIPSLYDNQDKQLARKVKEFLKKPPLNSAEYFEMLWLRRQSEPAFTRNDEDGLLTIKSAPTSPDELSRKLRHLRPEKRTIQSMILPPINDGCTNNYHNKYRSKTAPIIDPSVKLMDQLKYCRYLRPKPKRYQAWEERGQQDVVN